MSPENPASVIERKEAPVVVVSVATPEDAQAIRDVQYRTWLATYPENGSGITVADINWYFNDFRKTFSEEMLKKLAHELGSLPDSDRAIVAKDEQGKIVGYAWLTKHDNQNELGAIYIDPSFQGGGVGKRLWAEAEKFFDAAKETMLTVQEKNERAIGFYKKLGFEDTGKRLETLTFPSGATFKEIKMVRPADVPES